MNSSKWIWIAAAAAGAYALYEWLSSQCETVGSFVLWRFDLPRSFPERGGNHADTNFGYSGHERYPGASSAARGVRFACRCGSLEHVSLGQQLHGGKSNPVGLQSDLGRAVLFAFAWSVHLRAFDLVAEHADSGADSGGGSLSCGSGCRTCCKFGSGSAAHRLACFTGSASGYQLDLPAECGLLADIVTNNTGERGSGSDAYRLGSFGRRSGVERKPCSVSPNPSEGRMNRRGFLGLFSGAAAALVLDPERALWIPGKKLVSIPKPMVGVTTEQLQFIINEFRGNILSRQRLLGTHGTHGEPTASRIPTILRR